MGRLRRRQVLIGAAALLAAPLAVRAQQPAKARRIGFLSSESAAAWVDRVDALREGLREHGYVEGKNLAIEFRWAEGRYERLPELAQELVRLKPEVIVAGAAPASRAAKDATTTIPIVMAAVGDVVDFGFVSSLAHPGGNLTGSTFFSLELAAKRIELLKDALPSAKRVALILNPDNPGHDATFRAMAAAANALKLVPQKFEVRSARDLESSFAAIAKSRADALAVPNQPLFNVNAERIATLAARHRLASVGGAEFAEAGLLIGYGANFIDLYRGAAAYVDKILKGAKPADLPIERATKFELIVNLKTAKTLGVKVPQSLLLRADRVIE